MTNKERTRRVFGTLGIFLLVFILGYLAIRPFHLRWGATAEDLAAVMPGDLKGPRWTRAVTIAGTPEQVWPWLVQWGQGRGGWYSYDWLENLFGLNIHTARQILPEYQDLAVGDPICMGEGFCVSEIHVLEPYRWLGWQSLAEDGAPMWTFVFGLVPVDAGRTRLVMRESFDPAAMPAVAVRILELPDVVMGLKALDTVRARVEGRPVTPLTTAFEVGAWLTAFAVVVFSVVRAASQPNWLHPLLLGGLGVVVLLVITFLFPPLWLRGLLDLALLAGAVWIHPQMKHR